MGPRPDLADHLSRIDVLVPWLASITTGVLATVAAFHLTLPDRGEAWRLVPLPTLALWLLALGASCYSDWLRLGPDGLALGTSFMCLATIVLTSIPLSGLLYAMVRHGASIRPWATALTGALAVASLASAALDLFHGLSAAVMVLVWHLGSVALVVLVFGAIGRHRFARPVAAHV